MSRLVLFLALAVFAMGTSEFMLAGVLPAIAEDLSVTVGSAGALVSGFAAGMVIGAPLTAALARRWPPRAALLDFLAVFAAAHVVGALTTNFSVLLATRVIAALANAGFLAVAFTVAVSTAGAGRGARALSVLLAGTTVAMVVGVPAGALVGAEAGWRATFWVVAVLCVPPFLAIALSGPLRASGGVAGPVALRFELEVLRKPAVASLLVLTALVNAGTFGVLTYLGVLTASTLPERWVPLVLMVFGAGACAGITSVGRYADARPWRLLGTCVPALVIAWVALAIGGTTPMALIPLAGIAGLLAFAVGGTLISMSVTAATGAPTMAGAYATAALNVGAVVGPAAAGAALSGVGASGPAWFAAAAAALAAVGAGVLGRAQRVR